jgi:hypothetical protein
MGDVTTKIECDFFHGSGSTTDAATLRLRHLVIGLGNWTVGYTWSNWVDLDADAETVDFIGPVGQACYDTPRYSQIKYNFAIDKQNSLAVSLEENQNDEKFYAGSVLTSVAGATTVPSVKAPTIVAAYTYADTWGHLALRGMEQYWGAYSGAVAYQAAVPANPTTYTPAKPAVAAASSVSVSSWAGAVQLSGAWNVTKTDSIVASVYTGQGLGAYGADNGYDAAFDMVGSTVDFCKSTGWQAGWTHNWSDAWRTNVVLSGLYYSGDPVFQASGNAATNSDIKSTSNVFLNAIVKLTKSCELGVEYGYETATSFGSAGVVNANLCTSNMAHSNKIQATLTASF